ncbi:hypothetical protein [Kitasatospora sp. NPDC088783]
MSDQPNENLDLPADATETDDVEAHGIEVEDDTEAGILNANGGCF